MLFRWTELDQNPSSYRPQQLDTETKTLPLTSPLRISLLIIFDVSVVSHAIVQSDRDPTWSILLLLMSSTDDARVRKRLCTTKAKFLVRDEIPNLQLCGATRATSSPSYAAIEPKAPPTKLMWLATPSNGTQGNDYYAIEMNRPERGSCTSPLYAHSSWYCRSTQRDPLEVMDDYMEQLY